MSLPGPYYPLGTTHTVPRAYDVMVERIKKKFKNIKINAYKIQDYKNTFFQKPKIPP
jgi:hypothetical protein